MKKYVILIILVFSCSVAWGDYICSTCGNTYPDRGKVYSVCAVNHPEGQCCHYEEELIRKADEGFVIREVINIPSLKEEIESLKARIAELEAFNIEAALLLSRNIDIGPRLPDK